MKSLPWNDDEIAFETNLISQQLAHVNHNGVLTINSQPPVNGASSTDPIHGWGSKGGYVYQKVTLIIAAVSFRVIMLRLRLIWSSLLLSLL